VFGAWLAALAVAFAAARDLLLGVRRDWMRWVGVAGLGWVAVATTLYASWARLAALFQ
jgi:hypothetical protein